MIPIILTTLTIIVALVMLCFSVWKIHHHSYWQRVTFTYVMAACLVTWVVIGFVAVMYQILSMMGLA